MSKGPAIAVYQVVASVKAQPVEATILSLNKDGAKELSILGLDWSIEQPMPSAHTMLGV